MSSLHAFFYTVVCQYEWACTGPDDNGQRYVPSERDRDTTTSKTDGNSLLIYRVPPLDADCYGPVTTIEYCYRYSSSAGSGQVTFNWTVLILEESGNQFVINNIYVIQSDHSRSSANCTGWGRAGPVTCCDRTNINTFDLPRNFSFGIIASAPNQGNTPNAALLRYADALSQYRVDTIEVHRDSLTLSMGLTIMPSTPAAMRGLHLLWFVVGKH